MTHLRKDLFRIDSVVSSGGNVFRVAVTEGQNLAVNNPHRGVAQAVSRWAVTAFSRVLTWISAYGICG